MLAGSAHPACPQGRGCLPIPPSESPATSLGPPRCPAGTSSDALLGRGCSHPRDPRGKGGLQARGCQRCIPRFPLLPAPITVITGLWQPPRQSESDRVAGERVNQHGTGGAPGTPALDEEKRAGFGAHPEPQHQLTGTTRTGQSTAIHSMAQPQLCRAAAEHQPCREGRTPAAASNSPPETTLQLQPSSPSPGQGRWALAQGSGRQCRAALMMLPTRVMRTSMFACFPAEPGTLCAARPHWHLSPIPMTHPSAKSDISHPRHPSVGTARGRRWHQPVAPSTVAAHRPAAPVGRHVAVDLESGGIVRGEDGVNPILLLSARIDVKAVSGPGACSVALGWGGTRGKLVN